MVLAVTLTALGACGRHAGSGTAGAVSDTSGVAGGAGAAAGVAPVSGILTGLYVDVGNRPLFTECGSSRTWHVMPGKVAQSLDEAYLTVRAHPGDAARVTLVAHSTPQSARDDGGAGLVVDSVVLLTEAAACPGQEVAAPLTGTTWQALEIGGKPAGAGGGVLTLRLDSDTNALHAAATCRTLTGTFRRVGTQLTFAGIVSQNERCPAAAAGEAASLEATVLELLRTTGSYQIRGDTLDLMGETGVLARFTAAG